MPDPVLWSVFATGETVMFLRCPESPQPAAGAGISGAVPMTRGTPRHFPRETPAALHSWVTGLAGALPVSIALACYTATLVITVGVNIPLKSGLEALPARNMPQSAKNSSNAGGRVGTFTARSCPRQPRWPSALRGPCFDSPLAAASAIAARNAGPVIH